MMRPALLPTLATLTFLASLLLAGCSSSPPSADAAAAQDPILVRAPDDYSYVDEPGAMSRPHVHDYWGGRTAVPILDVNWTGGSWIGQPAVVGDYRLVLANWWPEDGVVVPQGTASLTVLVTFTDGVGDLYREPEVSARSPADDEFGDALPVTSGEPIRLAIGAEDADLPHQVISGWVFSVSIRPEEHGMRFTGTMRLEVTAERGLPIPLFPGHPDQWNGSAELRLLDREGEVSDLYNRDSGKCQTLAVYFCPGPFGPDDGVVVPADAAYVEVRFEVTGPSAGLDLAYHGADTRSRREVQPAEESDGVRLYRLPVRGDGDGPYTKQSLWEFFVHGSHIAGDRLLEVGTYHITATVYRDAPASAVPYSTQGVPA